MINVSFCSNGSHLTTTSDETATKCLKRVRRGTTSERKRSRLSEWERIECLRCAACQPSADCSDSHSPARVLCAWPGMNEAVLRARLPEEDRDERSDALDAWDDEDGDHDTFALAKSLARVHLDVSHVLRRNNSSSNSNDGVHSIYGQVKPPHQDAIITVPGSHLLKRPNKAKGAVEEEEDETDGLNEDEDEDDDCVDSGLGEDDLDVDDGDDYEDEDGDDQEELDEEQAKYERYSGNNLVQAEATACSTSGSSTSEDVEIPNPMQALQSPFGLEATVWFEYPAWLGIQRPQSADHITLQLVSKDAQKRDPSAFRWRSYWERKCLKDVFQAAGMQGGRGEKRRSAVVWTKHAKKWKALRSSQRHNHFAGSWTIGRKDRLAFTINRKKRENGTNAFGFLPETYILPLHAARLRQVLSAPQARRQTWIRKPLASSQGRGIRVLSHQAALEVVKTSGKRKGASSKKASSSRGCVVQRYIDRPLLINRFKFDIRLYVLVTGYDPLRVYLFPEGLVRFCTQPYSNSVASKKNQFRHLTNYSINKKSERFEHNQSAENDAVGSKWSLSAWYRYMEATFGGAATQKIRDDMEAVIVKTLIAADDDINQKMASLVPHSESCFELFGFDLMLDRDLRAWLVEVNISPSLMTASPLDRKVKTMLVCDALHLVGIPAPFESGAEAQAIAERQKVEERRPKGSRNVLGLTTKPWPALAAADRRLVQRVAGERLRRGHFTRIFPPLNNPDAHESYMKLFTTRRYNNALLQRFERAALKELSAATKLRTTTGLAQGAGFRHVRNRATSTTKRRGNTTISKVEPVTS